MMRRFDMKRYPRERGQKCVHYFGGAIILGGATIQGNTVIMMLSRLRVFLGMGMAIFYEILSDYWR